MGVIGSRKLVLHISWSGPRVEATNQHNNLTAPLGDPQGMGIRYWGSGKHALDLDKAFGDFQALWRSEPPQHRPAIELVRGWVTYTPRGWKSHFGVIEPDRVATVRDDIARTHDAEIELFTASGGVAFREEPDLYAKYLSARRAEMLRFLDERLARGEGVLYRIG
jgi:hypothetical protein